MSSYITRWCGKHGEWEQDVDDQYAECPQCVEEGITPTQLAYKATLAREAEIKKLMDEIERLRRENSDLDSGWQRTYDHDCGLLKAEIERLRGLLREALNGPGWQDEYWRSAAEETLGHE